MHLLYVDMSGSVGRADQRHFVMAGVSLYEMALYHVIGELKEIKRRALGERAAAFELHANEMWNGRGKWRAIRRERRRAMIADALSVLRGPSAANVRAFGIVIEKAALPGEDPVEHAYEQICSRFDLFLRRRYNRLGDRQRGLLVFDRSRYEETLQSLARKWREEGTRWGDLRNLAEVPFFVDSRATPLIQLADLLSYALWRRYEFGDATLLAPVIDAFDREGGVLHGLYHGRLPETPCDCAACVSRRAGR